MSNVCRVPFLLSTPCRTYPDAVCSIRAWRRYTPLGECNAAMRDGDWKLVRPAIDEVMQVSRDDFVMDVDAKFHPEKYTAIVTAPEPDRPPGAPPPPRLFNLRNDPLEQHDLAAQQPERVTRMQAALTTWFEEGEGDGGASGIEVCVPEEMKRCFG